MSVDAMPSAGVLRRFALLVLLAAPLGGCEWFSDFKRQPKVDPWEAYSYDSIPKFRGNPQASVPTTGTFAAGHAISYNPLPNVVDSMSPIPNPTAPSEASLVNGRKYYQINCAVCHGDTGAGNGPAVKYGMAGISIVTDMTRNRTDGYLYGMIRNGRGIMPSYNRIEEMDRWDVVNYVRGLQGRLGAPVPTGPVGAPGQTGETLPGPTLIGPNRWVPHTALPPATRDTASAATDTTRRAAPDTTVRAPGDSAVGRARNPGGQP
jgi:mono/diheme cytochrome c family protein